MAGEQELDSVVCDSYYQLKRRSGFIDSADLAENGYRKKDFYVFTAGSCFSKRFEGDIFDVSRNGRHPVYRYGKSMLMGVM